jgi:hypothetical protein
MNSFGTDMPDADIPGAAMLGDDSLAPIRPKRYWSRFPERLVQRPYNLTWLATILALTFILAACNQEERITTPAPEEPTPVPEEPTAVLSPTVIPRPIDTPLPLSTFAGSDGGMIAF